MEGPVQEARTAALLLLYCDHVHHGYLDGVVVISVTQIDLDDDALAEAMRLMGASTKKETVNAALTEYVARIKRLEAAEKLAARGERGEFEAAAAARQAAKQARQAAFE